MWAVQRRAPGTPAEQVTAEPGSLRVRPWAEDHGGHEDRATQLGDIGRSDAVKGHSSQSHVWCHVGISEMSPTQGAGILVFKDTTLVLCGKRLSHFKNGLFLRAGGRAQESAGPEAGAMERTGFLLCVPCCLDTGVEVGRGRGTFQLPPLRGISGVYCFILAETVETLPFQRAQKACLLHPTGEQVSGLDRPHTNPTRRTAHPRGLRRRVINNTLYLQALVSLLSRGEDKTGHLAKLLDQPTRQSPPSGLDTLRRSGVHKKRTRAHLSLDTVAADAIPRVRG